MIPLMIDILYKISRKMLSDDMYGMLRRSKFGRYNAYHAFETYQNIFKDYHQNIPDIKGKRIIEVGSGNQLYTALLFLVYGAEEVVLVEPRLHFSKKLYDDTIAELLHTQSFNEEYTCRLSSLSPRQIQCYDVLNNVPSKLNNQCDAICSHFVLEHFSDLDTYFANVERLLTRQGIAYSFVDLSDHTFHIFDYYKKTKWIFRRFPLNHLRYSNKTFHTINDQRSEVNRNLLPVYTERASQYGLFSAVGERVRTQQCFIHQDVLKKFTCRNTSDMYVTHFSLYVSKKRGRIKLYSGGGKHRLLLE